MVQHALHEESFLSVCKYYRAIYDTPDVKKDESKWIPVLQNTILFVILASFDNEQSDLIHRIYEDPNVSKLIVFKEFAKCFITTELMRWPKIEEIYGEALKSTFVFNTKSESGSKRLKELHKRVIEHNIRVISKYYTKITLKRLTQLLDLPLKETEEFLSNLVTSKMIYARIDRPAGVVSFETRKEANTILNDWASNINQLLELIVKTNCRHTRLPRRKWSTRSPSRYELGKTRMGTRKLKGTRILSKNMERLSQDGSQVVYPDLETILSLSSQNSLSVAGLLNIKKKLSQSQNTLHVNLVDESDSAIRKNRQQSSSAGRNPASSTMPTIPVSDLAIALASAREEEEEDERLLPSGKKRPGRKPSNIEPTNKRTAQNRAAQRAFRERRERYVKDLEIRVQQLESLSTDESSEASLNLLRENLQLKQKIQELEIHNSTLKNISFNLEFPLLEKAVATNVPLLFPAPSEQQNNTYLSDSFRFDISPYQKDGQSFVPTESGKSLFKDIFGHLPMPPSRSDVAISPIVQPNFGFLQSTNLFTPSIINSGSTIASTEENNHNLSNLLLDFSSPSFNQLRDSQTPYSITFEQSPQDAQYTFNTDWLDLIPKTGLFTEAVNRTDDVKEVVVGSALNELCEDEKLRNRVIGFANDESSLDELCQLFR
ncbi:hypothetical protein HK096_006576, partial [Nowakowskiella sp. JEL0078]